mgnify:CR=1 FL=1
MDDILGVEEERGFNLNTDKYNWDEHRDHFILQDTEGDVDFGEGKKNIFALPETEILIHKIQEVQMAVKTFGKDEVFISVVFHIASRIAVYFIEQFSGQHLLRRNFIAGILQIIMLRFMHMLKIRNTVL